MLTLQAPNKCAMGDVWALTGHSAALPKDSIVSSRKLVPRGNLPRSRALQYAERSRPSSTFCAIPSKRSRAMVIYLPPWRDRRTVCVPSIYRTPSTFPRRDYSTSILGFFPLQTPRVQLRRTPNPPLGEHTGWCLYCNGSDHGICDPDSILEHLPTYAIDQGHRVSLEPVSSTRQAPRSPRRTSKECVQSILRIQVMARQCVQTLFNGLTRATCIRTIYPVSDL